MPILGKCNGWNMLEVAFGIIAFILFVIYDLEQARFLSNKYHGIIRLFFLVGFVFLIISTISAVYQSEIWRLTEVASARFFLLCALFFLVLLFYTLFFALPFEETYVSQNGFTTYDKGVYALCRHPGVLWFFGFYLFLWLALRGETLFLITLIFNILNFGYVVLQDCLTFPRVFCDYDNYKKYVPFLIPNLNSIKECIKILH